jgi:PAS domain S-box-containing protein
MLDSFFIYGNLPTNIEKGVYRLPLVALSYAVACFASYTALSLAQQLVSAREMWERRILHWGGAFAMGAGIWSMHFIGMLSYKMRMVIEYDPWLTLLSMLIAVAFSYGVLEIIARKQLSTWQVLIGAVLLGIGICSMHYTGMAAMIMDGDLRYIPGIFMLSVLIAIIASGAALWMAFTLARHSSEFRYLFQLGAALVMGAAICGMHYTGMAASVFIPYAGCRFDPNQNFDMLALSIAAITSLILGLALAAGIYKKTQMEFQLHNSESKLRAMIENALDAVIAMDQKGIITEWNRQAEIIFGWSHREAVGSELAELIIPSTYREAHSLGMRRFFADGVGPILNKRIEMPALNRSGKLFPVELTVTAEKVYDTYHFTAFVRDITARKEAEQKIEEAVAKLTESNVELERFAYICSHDLQEPLRTISSFTQLLVKHVGNLDEKGQHYAKFITDGADNARALISDILAYARITNEQKKTEAVDCENVLAMVMKHMENSIEENGVTITHNKLPVVQAQKTQLLQLFQNIIGNAVKFHHPERKPKIHVGVRQQGDFWEFSIRDNGIGISDAYFEKVFDIFQRLNKRSEYPGTGIGLAICKKIVENYNGKIWLESNPGAGTVFFFTLPAIS